MGRLKKGHNWKARLSSNDCSSDSIKCDVKVNMSGVDESKYDESNALVLPAGKTKKLKDSKKGAVNKCNVKPLTKKQRKNMEKIVESKKRKENREVILESLKQSQATTEELKLMTSTAGMQTRGLKRFRKDENHNETSVNVSSLKGCRTSWSPASKRPKSCSDVVGFDSTDSEEENDSDEEEDDRRSNTEIDDASLKMDDENDTKEEIKITKDVKEISPKINESDASKYEATVVLSRMTQFVSVHRLPEIQESRLKLPITAEEQIIMEAINDNPVVILCGETGSGKTTQVPQFLYEAGYASESGIIGVTEPRRVAAIAMSKRVATEMNMSSDEISYQIRYSGNVTDRTKIKFMTDGVLLKEIQNDFLLKRYAVVIIDEAHERSVYTDILIGLLSRIVPIRNKRGNPLKLIIMSATLKIEDFTENKRLFKTVPPVIKVESRQFPVTVHFSKKTHDDYLTEAYKKVCKIHRQLPDGGILVFVTGQQEVNILCKKLRRTFPQTYEDENNSADEMNEENATKSVDKINKSRKRVLNAAISLDDYAVQPLTDDTEFEKDEDGIDVEIPAEDVHVETSRQPLHVLPLYSLLSAEQQAKVFNDPPDGTRLVVVATNVAETSLTIPNVKYVVDTGKVKGRFYDKVTGVSAFNVEWTSQASANQRAGRAGRLGPGHCYRLYSSAIFSHDFEKFSPPEICRKPVDDLVLQMKAMNIEKVVNFPFPSPPDSKSLSSSENRLNSLGAVALPASVKTARIKDLDKLERCSKITELGKVMSCFPISPRYAKMLAISHQHNLLPYVIAIISALTVQEVLMPMRPSSSQQTEDANNYQQKIRNLRKTWSGMGNSLLLGDAMILLKAVGMSEYVGFTQNWCQRHGLRFKAVQEIRKLRVQLTNAVNLVIPSLNISVDPKMTPPTDDRARLLRQIMLSGLPDHVARKIPTQEMSEEDKKKLKHAYHCSDLEDPVYVHPESILIKEQPAFVVYQEIIETTKLYMKGVTSIEPDWLPKFASHSCSFTTVNDSVPRFDSETDQILCRADATFGRRSWALPTTDRPIPSDLNKYKWFARFLLEGIIFPGFKEFKVFLLHSPATITRIQRVKLPIHTEALLKTLVKEEVDSRTKLMNVWSINDKYLLEAFKLWIPENLHDSVMQKWPLNEL